MRNFIVESAVVVLMSMLFLTSQAFGPAAWPGMNGGGDAHNSDPASLLGAPRVAWAHDLTGLHPIGLYPGAPQFGVRSLSLCIRGGELVVVVPSEDPQTRRFPNDKRGKTYAAAWGVFDAATGTLKRTIFGNHQNASPGIYSAFGGVMGNDTGIGLITASLTADGQLYTAHGSDYALARVTSVGPNPQGPYYSLAAGSNGSGVFVQANDNPYDWARGGNGGHDQWLSNYALHYWGSFLARGSMLYSYTASQRYSGPIAGIKITATKQKSAMSAQYVPAWIYDDPSRCFNCFESAPRPFCLAADDTVYWWGWKAKQNTAGVWASDFTQGMFLFGVKAGKLAAEIPSGFHITLPVYSYYTAQIATAGKYAVVFQPEMQITPAGLWCFDLTTGKLAWSRAWPKGAFKTVTNPSINWYNAEQAVQMTVAGDSAYVCEPVGVSGTLNLNLARYALTTGAEEKFTLAPQADGKPIPAKTYLALRELAAVDGRLFALIDHDQFAQAVVAVEGVVVETTAAVVPALDPPAPPQPPAPDPSPSPAPQPPAPSPSAVSITRDATRLTSIKVGASGGGVEVCVPGAMSCQYVMLQPDGQRPFADQYHRTVTSTYSALDTPLAVTQTMPGGLATRATYEPIGGGLRLRVSMSNAGPDTITGFTHNLQVFSFAWPTVGYGGHVISSTPGAFPILWMEGWNLPKAGLIACEDIQPAICLALGTGTQPDLLVRPAVGWLGLRPGETLNYAVLVSFDADSPAAKAALARVAAARPATLIETNRTPIGFVMLAGTPAVSAKNPDGYFPGLDPLLTKPFDADLNQYADNCIASLKRAGGNRLIVWDLEGEGLTIYAGSPGSKYPDGKGGWFTTSGLSPAMDAAADAFFTKLRDAGITPGLCLRPIMAARRSFVQAPAFVNDYGQRANLAAKIQYSRDRWGCKIFYVDSDSLVTADDYKALREQFPDVLLLSESSPTVGHYAHCGAYEDFKQGHFNRRTPELVRRIYPKALTAVVLASGYEFDAAKPQHALDFAEMVSSVKGGDVVMFPAWYGGACDEARAIQDAATK